MDEFAPLERVFLSYPSREFRYRCDPKHEYHDRVCEASLIASEIKQLAEFYRGLGIDVVEVPPELFYAADDRAKNFFFCRDQMVRTPLGLIVGSMGIWPRAKEPPVLARYLQSRGAPTLKVFGADETIEGADVLWARPDLAIVGYGKRTNQPAVRRLAKLVNRSGGHLKAFEVSYPETQHLLGALQFIGPATAFVRTKLLPRALHMFLTSQGFHLVDVPEWDEVAKEQAMNMVVLGPREVLIPSSSVRLNGLLLCNGVTVHQLPLSETIGAGGGFACLTGILQRECP